MNEQWAFWRIWKWNRKPKLFRDFLRAIDNRMSVDRTSNENLLVLYLSYASHFFYVFSRSASTGIIHNMLFLARTLRSLFYLHIYNVFFFSRNGCNKSVVFGNVLRWNYHVRMWTQCAGGASMYTYNVHARTIPILHEFMKFILFKGDHLN